MNVLVFIVSNACLFLSTSVFDIAVRNQCIIEKGGLHSVKPFANVHDASLVGINASRRLPFEDASVVLLMHSSVFVLMYVC